METVAAPLLLVLTAPQTAHRSQSVPFEIRVTNNTTEPMSNVVLRAQIPPGFQFMEGNVVEADVGTLPANATRAVHLEAQAVRLGRSGLQVSATAAGGRTHRSCAAVVWPW